MNTITKLCLIGVGRMGHGMRARWRKRGIDVVGFDINPEVSDVASLAELIGSMPAGKRVIWLMTVEPAYETTLAWLSDFLAPGDIIVDGGNSYWKTTQQRHARFAKLGIEYVDVGTSGGVLGPIYGYALMFGGSRDVYNALQSVLKALAPDQDGLVYCGPSGAGHQAKMIHNGIEYGIMQSLAEGYSLLERSELIENPEAILASWRKGSIITSLLLEVLVEALKQSDVFDTIAPVVFDSGEGRWTVELAIDLGVPTPAISAALNARFTSQGGADEANRANAAMRLVFGGHPTASAAA